MAPHAVKLKSPETVLRQAKQLLARAAHPRTGQPESQSALRLLVETLNRYRPELRYCYPKGAEVKIIPTRALDTAQAKRLFRVVKAHRPGALMENQRVLDEAIVASAIGKGYLPFSRHGYYLFVSVRTIEIRI